MIKNVKLVNFRNFRAKKIDFDKEITVIVGPNASGKTNILESLFLVSTGKSFKAQLEEEMITYGKAIARVGGQALIGSDSQLVNLEVVLTRGEMAVGKGSARVEKTPRKRLLLNSAPKRLIDFAGNFRAVVFGPWDLDLVTESPSLRRRFLDAVLSQVDREYRRASVSYEKGLRQRNKLLLRIREEGVNRSQLSFWDRLLIKNGDYLSRKREELITFANSKEGINNQRFVLEYDKSAISETRLKEYAEEEVAAATTLVGPHRDDFVFKTGEKKGLRDLSRFGSRGEQRMGVLWLKLAELSFVEEKTEEKPTLLLDDIFSELDHEHREIVMDVAKRQQTVITTADPHFVGSFKKVEKVSLGG